jgi:hypothetical protein
MRSILGPRQYLSRQYLSVASGSWKISLESTKMKAIVKRVLTLLLLSGVLSMILGIAAFFLYFFSYCWDGRTDCAAYSPTRRWIAFVLAPPIFLMQRWFFGTVENVSNFDPVVFGRSGWVALWAYYFMFTSGIMGLYKRHRSRSSYVPHSKQSVSDSQGE